MSRILIVDDRMAANLMSAQDGLFSLGSLYEEDFDEKAFEKRVEFSNKNPYFDLSADYHALGGKVSREIFVLSEPKCFISSNDIYNYEFSEDDSRNFYYRDFPQSVETIRRNFDFENIVDKIKKINPDILLLDLGITASVSDDKRAELAKIYSEKSKTPVKLIDVPVDKQYPNIFNGPFVEYSPDGKERNKTELDYLLDNAGGVILGHYLKQEGIPFRLWTGDYGHGRENIILAHVFNLVTAEDLNEFMNAHILRYVNPVTTHDYFGFFSNKSKSIMSGLKDKFGKEYEKEKADFFQGDISSIDLILEGLD